MDREQIIEHGHDFLENYHKDYCSPVEEESWDAVSEWMADFAIEQMQPLQAENAELRKACQIAMEACQDNLKAFAYKNEQALLNAYEACESVLKESE